MTMNNLHEYIGLIIAIIVVLIVIAAQIYSFLKTKKKISELEGLFEDVDNLSLKETSITSGILQNKSSLQKFLQNIPSRYSDEDDSGDEYTDLSLIVPQNKNIYGKLGLIIYRTNEYLCKNTGTSADLGILEDICDSFGILENGCMTTSGDLYDIKDHVHKIQIAFKEELNKEEFSHLDVLSFHKQSRVINMVVKGDINEIKDYLRMFNPIMLEVLPVNLEEIFIYEMERKGYGVYD